MNLPKKSPNSETRPLKRKEDLAKLHCVHHLFADATGDDPYLIHHIKDAIDETLREEEELDQSLDTFTEAALRLFEEQPFLEASYGLFHLDLRDRGFDPLFVRTELVAGLKRVAGFETALVVVSGLKRSLTRRMTSKQRQRYEAAIDYIDQLALQWTTENTTLTILYL